MKDPKNIDTLNELVITYMSLHGLQGMSMDQNNPFTVYYMMIMRGSIHSMETDDLVVPNSLVHPMVKYAYDFYKEVNEFNSMINPMMKEQVINVLGESEFDNFLESSVEKFKRCLLSRYTLTNESALLFLNFFRAALIWDAVRSGDVGNSMVINTSGDNLFSWI